MSFSNDISLNDEYIKAATSFFKFPSKYVFSLFGDMEMNSVAVFFGIVYLELFVCFGSKYFFVTVTYYLF